MANECEAAKMWPGGKGVGAKKSENEKIKTIKNGRLEY